MPAYRLYLLNQYSGHIDGVEHLSSADDVGAIAVATERKFAVPTELWCGNRKVCRFDAPPEVSKYGLRGGRGFQTGAPANGRSSSVGAPALAK